MTLDKTRTNGHSQFATEADFVDGFVGKLAKGRTAFGRVQITTEWDHRAGFVDVLARNQRKDLVAFEAKLDCPRRLNIDPPCRSNIDPGLVAAI